MTLSRSCLAKAVNDLVLNFSLLTCALWRHLTWVEWPNFCVFSLFLPLSRMFSIPLDASSLSTRKIILSWTSWTFRSRKTLASMNVMPPTPLTLPQLSPSSGYGATWPLFGLFWEFWLKSSSLWWSLLCMRRERGQMKFLTVRSSLQNSLNIGVGFLGVVSKHPKRMIKILGFSCKRKEGKFLYLVFYSTPKIFSLAT